MIEIALLLTLVGAMDLLESKIAGGFPPAIYF